MKRRFPEPHHHGAISQLLITREQVRDLRRSRINRVERPILDLHEVFEAVLRVEDGISTAVSLEVLGLVEVEEDDTAFWPPRSS
ncbi:hypothetical protein BJF95_23185 [Rhizobium oryziradicis]|uniref:Uncharacterized protein n=2 Tax=Rhizobium oryziradicis TaxID=1867956 RepID=A0A1Q8ZPB3_9HYPH|nr:hypothetical protein BJF95_23185 [Rhizobium oryziradicis]